MSVFKLMESNELQRNLALIVLKLWLDLIFIVALAIQCKYPLLLYLMGEGEGAGGGGGQPREKGEKLKLKQTFRVSSKHNNTRFNDINSLENALEFNHGVTWRS